MKKIAIAALCCVLMVAAGCKGGKQEQTSESAATVVENGTKTETDMQEETKVRISTSKGDMVVKLYDETPLHKANFLKLAKSGFYNGILFHRVINGFMIQCGDPLTKDYRRKSEWGQGGPGYTIPAEIKEGLTHKKGALAAARLSDFVNPEKESSGSQFYIVQSESGCKHLDGEYTVFGEVVEGLDVIDKIASVSTGMADCPIEEVKIIVARPL